MRLALAGCRPALTKHADLSNPEHATLKLHVKVVGRLDYAKVRGILLPHLAAAYEDAWQRLLSVPWLQQAIDSPEVRTASESPAWQRDADLLPEDVALLEHRAHIVKIDARDVRGRVRVFTTIEAEKQRRRMIAEPIINNYFTDGGEIKLATLSDILAPLNQHANAMALDFPWFYGQMSVPAEAQPYYCFMFREQWYALTTVPTGARHVPAIAEAITKSLSQRAVQRTCRTMAVPESAISDTTYIDNTRFTANDTALIRATHSHWKELCTKLAITLDDEGTAGDIVTTYDFLGIHCVHQPPNSYVQLTTKTSKKLERWIAELDSGQPTLRTILRGVGVGVWASRVLALPLALVYYVFKFVRRRVAAGWQLDTAADMWANTKPLLAAWFVELGKNKPRSLRPDCDEPWMLITDASMSGYGIITIPPPSLSLPCRVIAGTWAETEYIHILEARAALAGVMSLPRQGALVGLNIVVDNTSLIGAGRKTHSRSFVLNSLVYRIHEIMDAKSYVIARWEYITSAENPADYPSRLFEETKTQSRQRRIYERL
jgi:hypothetical protein